MIHRNANVPEDLESQIGQYKSLIDQAQKLFWQSIKRVFVIGLPVSALWVYFAFQFFPNLSPTTYAVIPILLLPSLVQAGVKGKKKGLESRRQQLVGIFARRGFVIEHDAGLNVSIREVK